MGDGLSYGEYTYVHRVAMALCCTRKHVYDLIKDGKLEAIRLGRRGIRVSVESVKRFIAEQRINPDDYFGSWN